MSLFGKAQDIAFFRGINRELINDVLDIAVDIYKPHATANRENIYGETVKKVYNTAVRVKCLLEVEDQEWSRNDAVLDINQKATYSFLRHELREHADLVIEVGDIIHWNDIYWEVDSIIQNKLLFGKDPDFDKTETDTGDNFAVICATHQTRRDKVTIERVRRGNNNRPRFT